MTNTFLPGISNYIYWRNCAFYHHIVEKAFISEKSYFIILPYIYVWRSTYRRSNKSNKDMYIHSFLFTCISWGSLRKGMIRERGQNTCKQGWLNKSSITLMPLCHCHKPVFRPKMAIFWRAGMREGGKPLPLAFQYLILMIWRPCDLNLVMISSLASKYLDVSNIIS